MNEHVAHVPSVSVSYAHNGSSTKANALGMRPMQERAYEKRGEQYLLIKGAHLCLGKSRALMFIALDKIQNQGPQAGDRRRAGEDYRRELSERAAVAVRLFGRTLARRAEMELLCNAPGPDNGGKVKAVGAFLKRRRQGAGLHPRYLPLRRRSVRRRRGVR